VAQLGSHHNEDLQSSDVAAYIALPLANRL